MKKKFLSLMLLGLVCSIGNVWGDVTYHTITSNIENTQYETYHLYNKASGNANSVITGYSSNTITWGTGFSSWVEASGIQGLNSSNYTMPSSVTGWYATSNSGINVRAHTITFHVTNCVEVAFISKSGGNSRTTSLSVKEKGSSSELGTVATNGNTVAEVVYGTELDASKSYDVVLSSSDNSSNSQLYQIRFKAPATAQAPTFNPSNNSSITSESSVEITSANATTVYYKWTTSTTTPTDGWSSATANASGKITVTAPAYDTETPANNTRYLHAYGEKSSTAGSKGYAKYTITAPDTDAPVYSTSSPSKGGTNFALDAALTITYNENIVINDNTKITLKDSENADVEFTYNVAGAVLTITPSASLSSESSYTLTIAAGALKDVSGNVTTAADVITFTTIKEAVATPTISVVASCAFRIDCETEGATIYYTSDGSNPTSSATRQEFTMGSTEYASFKTSGTYTIKAYAEKSGATPSEVVSADITVPTAGDNFITGDLLITLRPATEVTEDATYESNTFSSGGYTLVGTKTLKNTKPMNAKFPIMFKSSKQSTITITAPEHYIINAIKVYILVNKDKQAGSISMVSGYTRKSSNDKIVPRHTYNEDGDLVLSEHVIVKTTPDNVSAFTVDGSNETRFYVEVYGEIRTVTATVGTYGWASFNSDYALDLTGKDFAYAITGVSGEQATAVLVQQKVAKNTPLLIKGTGKHEIPVIADDDAGIAAVSGNCLKAVTANNTTVSTESGYTNYVLCIQEGNAVFAPIGENSATLSKGMAYLQIEDSEGEAPSIIRLEDEENNATNIKTIDNKEQIIKFFENGKLFILRDGVVYDVTGRIVK